MFLIDFQINVCKSYVLSRSQFKLKAEILYSCTKNLPILSRNLIRVKDKNYDESQN